MTEPSDLVYRICSRRDWELARSEGVYAGGELDRKDGFIHLSSRDQVQGTAEAHYSDQRGLLILCIDFSGSKDEPRWERSRGGLLFPHLYGELNTDLVTTVVSLPDDPVERRIAISSL